MILPSLFFHLLDFRLLWVWSTSHRSQSEGQGSPWTSHQAVSGPTHRDLLSLWSFELRLFAILCLRWFDQTENVRNTASWYRTSDMSITKLFYIPLSPSAAKGWLCVIVILAGRWHGRPSLWYAITQERNDVPIPNCYHSYIYWKSWMWPQS